MDGRRPGPRAWGVKPRCPGSVSMPGAHVRSPLLMSSQGRELREAREWGALRLVGLAMSTALGGEVVSSAVVETSKAALPSAGLTSGRGSFVASVDGVRAMRVWPGLAGVTLYPVGAWESS